MVDQRLASGARTRSALIQSSIGILMAEGDRAVTQRRVAERAGVSLASTTYHFRTVGDLFAATFEEITRRTVGDLRAYAQDVLAGRTELVDAAVAFASRPPDGDAIAPDGTLRLFLAAAHRPELRPHCDALVAAIAEVFQPFVGPPHRAATLVRSFLGILLAEVARGPERDSARLRDDLDVLLVTFGVVESVARHRNTSTAPEHDETSEGVDP
ncbi:hypothetical protein ABT160_40370 [Streptomyces sp. NPDC001941]|uniref:TetR/AcrR family transcriptional regulator n=1 Tax=Streptomyces sp. NPDC001941 TaxID=3154659 RepID=UPI00332214A0